MYLKIFIEKCKKKKIGDVAAILLYPQNLSPFTQNEQNNLKLTIYLFGGEVWWQRRQV